MNVRALLAAGLLLASLTVAIQDAGSSPSGPLVIAGHGPELPTIEMLARAFERANPRVYIDILFGPVGCLRILVPQTSYVDTRVGPFESPRQHLDRRQFRAVPSNDERTGWAGARVLYG